LRSRKTAALVAKPSEGAGYAVGMLAICEASMRYHEYFFLLERGGISIGDHDASACLNSTNVYKSHLFTELN